MNNSMSFITFYGLDESDIAKIEKPYRDELERIERQKAAEEEEARNKERLRIATEREARRREEARRKAEEALKAAELRRAEEARRRAEEARKAEERRKAEEAYRRTASQAKKAAVPAAAAAAPRVQLNRQYYMQKPQPVSQRKVQQPVRPRQVQQVVQAPPRNSYPAAPRYVTPRQNFQNPYVPNNAVPRQQGFRPNPYQAPMYPYTPPLQSKPDSCWVTFLKLIGFVLIVITSIIVLFFMIGFLSAIMESDDSLFYDFFDELEYFLE